MILRQYFEPFRKTSFLMNLLKSRVEAASLKFPAGKRFLQWRVIFVNETELLRLQHYQIRQTIAQSKCLDEYTSGKPKENFQKIFNNAIIDNWSFRLGSKIRFQVQNRSLRNRAKVLRGRLLVVEKWVICLKKPETHFFKNCVGGKFFENFLLGVGAWKAQYHSKNKSSINNLIEFTFDRAFKIFQITILVKTIAICFFRFSRHFLALALFFFRLIR